MNLLHTKGTNILKEILYKNLQMIDYEIILSFTYTYLTKTSTKIPTWKCWFLSREYIHDKHSGQYVCDPEQSSSMALPTQSASGTPPRQDKHNLLLNYI